MQTFVLTLGLMALLMLGMAVGWIVQRKELKGSCGGIGGACACENAGRPGACKEDDPLRDANFQPPGRVTSLRRS